MAGTSHGHTPAAWTGSIIAFLGFCITGACTVVANVPGFWVGIGVCFLGAIVGGLMRLAGLGQERRPEPHARTSH
jgi:hypothetical protein